MHLHNGKRYVWVENTYLNQNILKKKKNLKLVISKILCIAFIVAMFLLNHINVTFQSTSILLNLNENLSKYKGYEYTNVIFKAVIHFFLTLLLLNELHEVDYIFQQN